MIAHIEMERGGNHYEVKRYHNEMGADRSPGSLVLCELYFFTDQDSRTEVWREQWE